MIDSQPLHTSNGRDSAASAVSPIGLLVALGRNWALVLATAVVAMLAGLGLSLLRSPVYSAQTLLFLAQGQTDPRSQLAAQFSGGGGGGANAKLVTTVLSSRTLAEAVGREAGNAQNMQVQSNVDGSIRIVISHSDPQAAARIANAYPKLLNVIVSRTGAQTNREKEELLERQIAAARQRLEESEDALVRYQTGRNATDVEGQASATLNAAVNLQQRIAEKEVEIVALRRTSTPDNPRLRAANSELGALRQQLERLSSGGGSGRILVPFQESPALRVGAARVMREYTRNEQIYVALNTALAQAQIELNGSLPVVTVVDPAEVPVTPSGPGVPVTLLVSGVIGLVAGACLAIAMELVRYARRDPERDPFLAVWRGIRAERAPHMASRS